MEKPMNSRVPGLFRLVALLPLVLGCLQRPVPAPGVVSLEPGRYVLKSFLAPGFSPAEHSYEAAPFPVQEAINVSARAFEELFFQELEDALAAQGLRMAGRTPLKVSGIIHRLELKGSRMRWLTGRLHAKIILSGTVSRGETLLFAFFDEVSLSSPVAPGRASPLERDLLLRRLAREAAHHILNELLLQRMSSESG